MNEPKISKKLAEAMIAYDLVLGLRRHTHRLSHLMHNLPQRTQRKETPVIMHGRTVGHRTLTAARVPGYKYEVMEAQLGNLNGKLYNAERELDKLAKKLKPEDHSLLHRYGLQQQGRSPMRIPVPQA